VNNGVISDAERSEMNKSFGHAARLSAAVASVVLAAGVLATSASAAEKGSATGACRCAVGLVSLDVSASALGLSTAQLQAELKTGKTLAQVAAAEGKPVGAVAESIVAAAATALSAAVTNGTVTQGHAEATLLSLPWQLTRIIGRAQLGALGGNCGLVVLDISFAAAYLHMRVAELRAALSTGKTLAEIAAIQGRPLEAVRIDASAATAASVAAVPTLTQAQATELTTELAEQISTVVGGLGG
jgi:hypothetical protein